MTDTDYSEVDPEEFEELRRRVEQRQMRDEPLSIPVHFSIGTSGQYRGWRMHTGGVIRSEQYYTDLVNEDDSKDRYYRSSKITPNKQSIIDECYLMMLIEI